MSSRDLPPDDAYSRVTNPERFRPLHDVARELVASLVVRFDATVEEEPHVDGDVLRVVPRLDGAASLTFTLTDFPGVKLAAGRHFDGAYPQCGCDACDEQVDDVSEQLHRHVAAITEGRFAEAFDGERRHRWLGARRGRESGWTLDLESSGEPPWSVRWAAWPTRPAASG